MDFSLTKEQEMLKKLAAQFAEEELEPVAAEIDAEHGIFPENLPFLSEILKKCNSFFLQFFQKNSSISRSATLHFSPYFLQKVTIFFTLTFSQFLIY